MEDYVLDVGKDKGKKSGCLCMFVYVCGRLLQAIQGWCIVMPGTASCKTLVDWLSGNGRVSGKMDADSECPQGVHSDNWGGVRTVKKNNEEGRGKEMKGQERVE